MIGVKKLQDFSKAMIGPVLYLPVIGLLIALLSMTTNKIWLAEDSSLYLLGKYVSSMLWAVMNNLGFFFCLGLAGGLAKTRKAEAAFVAAMTWFMYLAANNSWLTLTQRLAAGASNAQLYGSGQTYIFGFQVIDMGVFLGIILGCAVAFIHNRFVEIEFRGAFSIYGNSKLVLIIMIPLVGVFAIATVYVWPIVEHGISALTGVMKTFGAAGVFLYGFLNRFLIPTGLHHLIWSPFVFTSIGGQLLIDGQTVVGAKPIFLALIPLIVTSFLVGITEPFEFLFIFTAPLLWLVYSLLDGFFQMLAWLLDVRVCATNGIIDFIVYNIPAGAHLTRWPVFIALGLMETAAMYYVGKFMIIHFKMPTPGQEQEVAVVNQPPSAGSPDAASGEQVILGLGGKENVCSVDNCFTRLRVDVRDPALIQEHILKTSGGTSVIIKGHHVQVIYGLGVNKIRNAVNRYLDVHE